MRWPCLTLGVNLVGEVLLDVFGHDGNAPLQCGLKIARKLSRGELIHASGELAHREH
jgi:hypothetical protein